MRLSKLERQIKKTCEIMLKRIHKEINQENSDIKAKDLIAGLVQLLKILNVRSGTGRKSRYLQNLKNIDGLEWDRI